MSECKISERFLDHSEALRCQAQQERATGKPYYLHENCATIYTCALGELLVKFNECKEGAVFDMPLALNQEMAESCAKSLQRITGKPFSVVEKRLSLFNVRWKVTVKK